ncbi:hypothetical protein [Piscinibacter sp. XHJ-5]|uniref:hypothetical protein n=1 Tax=Piscinibacter sp. XHJ-5 TaxID=3037797 RepID=UPI002452CA77|nr:hypothetical protein [Piscinibacter sp. XHJ-5]
MTSRQIEVRIQAAAAPPRGAVLAGTLAAWLLQGLARGGRALLSRPAAVSARHRHSRAW